MFNDTQLGRYADVMVWALQKTRKQTFKKGELVLLQFNNPALKLAEAVYTRLMAMGVNIVQRMAATNNMEHSFYANADEKRLVFLPPGEKELCAKINGRIFLYAPESLTHLRNIEPQKIGKFLTSRKSLWQIMQEREQKGVYGWSLCVFSTQAMADGAGMSIKNYAKEIIKACYLDESEPVKKWEEIYRELSEIKKRLNSLAISSLLLESARCELRVGLGEHRQWLGVSGHNVPSFEIFTSPDCRLTEGSFYANLPSYKNGNIVQNLRVSFAKGSVQKVSADEGEAFAKKIMAIDKGAAMVGEFSLTDKRFSRIDRFMADTLYDENHGGKFGNSHIALGTSFADTYSKNQRGLTKALKKKLGFNDSAIHWDIVNTEKKTVTAQLKNGKKTIIYENGIFCCG